MSEKNITTSQPSTVAKPAKPAQPTAYLRPQYQVTPGKDEYTVQVFIPGASKDGVSITVDQDTLSLEAKRKQVANDSWQARYREIPTADYRLRLQLNVPVDAEKIAAKTANGVLSITLPVAEAAKPRQIAVN